MIHKTLKDAIVNVWKVNDRISVLQLQTHPNLESEITSDNKMIIRKLPTKYSVTLKGGLKMKFVKTKNNQRNLITIINVYAPHSGLTRDSPKVRDNFYIDLNKIYKSSHNNSSMSIIAGDFNSEIGPRTNDDTSIGSYSIGTRNENGEELINFCELNNLFVSNTSFQHKATHLYTWEQTRIIDSNKTVLHIKKAIDFIIIDRKFKHILRDSRVYRGTLSDSDHNLLVTQMNMSRSYIFSKTNKSSIQKSVKYNTQLLTHNSQKRKEYSAQVDTNLHAEPRDNTWSKIKDSVKSAAEKVIGVDKEKVLTNQIYNQTIEGLSNQQKDLRMKIDNCNDPVTIRSLRSQRNKVLKNIKKEKRKINELEMNEIADQINTANNGVQFFKAIKHLRQPRKNKIVPVHDENGQSIINKQAKYARVKSHFESHFFKPQITEIEHFIGQPKPLTQPITNDEVEYALTKMSNNKACGEDGIPAELLKYTSKELKESISFALNKIFEEHQDDMNIGKSILLPIPKPKKTEGPVKNLRPINLLNVIRKVLSTITLSRIKPQVENYLPPTQSAYRPGRSTSDIVWAHRFIAAKCQLYQNSQVYIVGIDMSSAFDTIDRRSLLNELTSFLNEDECRMIRLLLSNTSITIRFDNHEPETVSTNIGSPQGDSISGCLFNIELERALRSVREKVNTLKPSIEHSYAGNTCLPSEMEYADDTDFMTESFTEKEYIKSIVKDTLAEHNLLVNDDKTEETLIQRGKSKSEEEWRHVRKLGSLLGDFEDVKRRIQLSYTAMSSVNKLWYKKNMSIYHKLKIYKTLVKPVLIYNCGTWGLTKQEQDIIDRAHRQQLRKVWQNFKLKNKQVYEMSNECPISHTIIKTRWTLLGHISRLPQNAPAQAAMSYYFQVPKDAKKFRGMKRRTLPEAINLDIKKASSISPDFPIKQFETAKDLERLRKLSQDRNNWKALVEVVFSVAQGDQPQN